MLLPVLLPLEPLHQLLDHWVQVVLLPVLLPLELGLLVLPLPLISSSIVVELKGRLSGTMPVTFMS